MASKDAHNDGPRPAKIMTPAIRQRLQELLTKARRLSRAERCPHDEIDELLCECVIVDPGNTAYIGALLHHVRRSDRPRQTGFQSVLSLLSGLVGHDPLQSLRRAVESQNWGEVLTHGPPLLPLEPQSAEVLRHMATGCAAFEHEQAELCYLQAAVSLAPDDAQTQRQLAKALTRQGRFDEAITAWERLEAIAPADEECRQTINLLSDHPPLGEARNNVLAADEEHTLRAAIESGAASQDQFRSFLGHLIGSRRFPEAEQLLRQASVFLGNSLRLQEWQEDLMMLRGRNDWSISRKLAALQPEYAKLPPRKEAESQRTDLQVYYHRCERHPGDLSLQVQLARLLLLNGNYSEAIKRLEPATHNSEFRAEALCLMGESLQKLKQTDRAVACFQESIDLATAAGDEQTRMRAVDLLAPLLTA